MRRVCLLLIGLVWLLAWWGVLLAVIAPWRDLGGIVGERWRWLARFSLWAGLIVGYAVGGWFRRVHPPESARAYPLRFRRAVFPVAALTAVLSVAFRASGRAEAVGVVIVAFAAYWAGWDAAFCAFRLIRGPAQEPEGGEQGPEGLTLARPRGSGKIHS